MPLLAHAYPGRQKRHHRGGFELPWKSGDAVVSKPSHESRSLEREDCDKSVAKEENWHTHEIQECKELAHVAFIATPQPRPTGTGNTEPRPTGSGNADPPVVSFPKLKKVGNVAVMGGKIAKLDFPKLTEVVEMFRIDFEESVNEVSIPKLRTVGTQCTAHRAGVLTAPGKLWAQMKLGGGGSSVENAAQAKLAQAKTAAQELKARLEAQTQELLDVLDS